MKTNTVYSYSRFSSPEQAFGDSERRQWEAAQAYAKEKGFVFDESLRMTDRGLSGYHGMHRRKGALGAFLAKVESGAVAPGSVLVVENIDRLGREPMMDTLKTILFGLLERGVTIETLFPRDTYTAASINNNAIWQLVAHIQRANAESERKSQLAKANWKQKRKLATEKILTRRAPAWLRVVDGQFEVIDAAAKTIRLIFQLKLEGFGKGVIERKLNHSAPWTPPKSDKHKGAGWRASYIEKILRNRAVLGELQPYRLEQDKDGKRVRVPDGEPIAGYFPAVIEPAVWHRCQSVMSGNNGTGGRTGKATNVFQNLVKCAYCGGSMVFINKGDSNKGGHYLVCDNGRRQVKAEDGKPKCGHYKVRYEEFQETVLNNLSKLRPETVLPNADEQAAQGKQLSNSIAGLAGEASDIEGRMKNLIEQIERTDSDTIRARYEQRLKELEAKQVEIKTDQEQKESALRDLQRNGQSFADWQKNLRGLKDAIARNADSRIRLKAHLKELVNKIEVFAAGHEDTSEHALALVEEYMPKLERAKSFPAFKSYLRKRLVSSDARFYKLHLRNAQKSSAGLQLAPVASLAGGVSIKPGPDGWKFSAPKLETLAKEFFDARKANFAPKASVL